MVASDDGKLSARAFFAFVVFFTFFEGLDTFEVFAFLTGALFGDDGSCRAAGGFLTRVLRLRTGDWSDMVQNAVFPSETVFALLLLSGRRTAALIKAVLFV